MAGVGWVSPQHSGKWCFGHNEALPGCSGCARERRRICECCEFVVQNGQLRRQEVGSGRSCDKCTRHWFVEFTGSVADIDPLRRAGPFNTASLQYGDVKLIERVRASERERAAKIAEDYVEDSGVCAEIAARIRSGE